MSKNSLRESRRSFDKYCASCEFVYRGPKRLLKTQFFEKKKANFPVKKRFWPSFSRIIEFRKPQGKNCTGPKGFLAATVEITRSFR